MNESGPPKTETGLRDMLEFLASHSPYGDRIDPVSEQIYWSPPADVYEINGTLFIVVEIAGMKSKDFQIRVESETLVIRGERRTTHHKKRRRFHSLEWRSGPFEKKIPLPAGFDLGRPNSRYVDGVLEISFPGESEGPKA